MSLQTRLTDLVTAVGGDIKALKTRLDSGKSTIPNGPTLTMALVLNVGDPVPANTPAGTPIIRI